MNKTSSPIPQSLPQFPFSKLPVLAFFFCLLIHTCAAQSLWSNTSAIFSIPNGANADCIVDPGATRPGHAFWFRQWWQRGRCVRNADNYEQCSATLAYVLDNLDSLHLAEYSAAATTLALIPTIGALFGTPTAEIWALQRLLPLGGALVMLLSFGGALTPRSLGEYLGEAGRWSEEGRTTGSDLKGERVERGQKKLEERIKTKVRRGGRMTLPLRMIAAGLCGMVVLLASVLVGIAVVAIGSVYMTFCTAVWWFHLWWLVVTFVTVLDSWAQLPFDHYIRLYISDLRIGYVVSSGLTILDDISQHLHQLDTLNPGQLTIEGSRESTSARNTLLVIISIARDVNAKNGRTSHPGRYALQLFLKLGSVTIYVFATSIFAAVVLLALPMAQMVLMLILGAGIGARAIAGHVVSAMAQQDSLLHIIVHTQEEADEIIAAAFRQQVDDEQSTKFQIEIEGHVFVDAKRVKSRSRWRRRLLGVLASPHDFTRDYRAGRQGYRSVSAEKEA